MTRWLLGFSYVRHRVGTVVRIALAVFFCAVLIYYAMPRQQAFTVSASTEYLVVETVTANAPEWEVPQIDACIRTDAPRSSDTIAGCDARFFDAYRLRDVVLRWSDGYRLIFEGVEADAILVSVERGDTAAPVLLDGFARSGDTATSVEITQGSLLRIPVTDTVRPMLPMRGRVTIGQVPRAADAQVLRVASYEIRQSLGLSRRPAIVAGGTFFAGDRIGFVHRRAPFWAGQGHPDDSTDVIASLFVTDLSRGDPAFDLVATTPPHYSALRVTRIGGQPTVIGVSWTQRVASDALPVAVATLLGLLGTMLALFNAYFNTAARKRAEDPKN